MRKAFMAGGLAVLLAAVLGISGDHPRPARADSYTYAPQTRQINACMLLIDSTGLENPDPHILYILNRLIDYKPRGWEIVNPLAPRRVDQRIWDRWSNPSGGIDPGHPYTLDGPVTQNMACYWEVRLSDTSLDDLLKFDLIIVTTHNTCKFLPADREKLRRLVDMGGTIWMDNCSGNSISALFPFFIREFNFFTAPVPATVPTAPRVAVADPYHPLVTTPFALSDSDVDALGDKGADNYRYVMTNLAQNGLPDPLLTTVVYSKGVWPDGLQYPVISGAHYGDGTIVTSGLDIGCGINDQYNGGPNGVGGNGGAYCGDLNGNPAAANFEFAYNLLDWAAGESNFRKGARRTAFTRDEVTPTLDPAWKIPLPANVHLSAAPVIWRDFVYFGTDDGFVYCADARPYEDRDSDGNANDGIPDGIPGIPDLTPAAPYDIIWRANLNGAKPSAMFMATVTVNGQPIDALFFTTPDGKLHAFDALPKKPDPNNANHLLLSEVPAELPGYPVDLTAGVAGVTASAPVVSRGRVYTVTRLVAAPKSIYALDVRVAATGLSALPWAPAPDVPLGEMNGVDNSPLPAPTAGLVKNDKTGGTMEMCYAALPNGSLAAVALHVYEETADPKEDGQTNADPTLYATRFSWARTGPGELPTVVSVYDQNNVLKYTTTSSDPNLVPTVEDPQNADPTLPGYVLRVRGPKTTAPPSQPLDPRWRVTVEYDVNPMSVGGTLSPVTAPGYSPWPPNGAPMVSGAMLTPDDLACFATGNGFVETVASQGAGAGTHVTDDNKVTWRYNVNDYTTNDGGATYQRTTANPWVPARLVNGTWVPLAPAVTDNMIYVAMNLYDAGGNPVQGRIFAFDRKPKFTINLAQPVSGPPIDVQALALGGDPMHTMTMTQYSPEDTDPNPANRWKLIHDPSDPELAKPTPDLSKLDITRRFWSLDMAKNQVTLGQVVGSSNYCYGQDLTINPTLPVWIDPDGPAGPIPPSAFLPNGGRTNLVWEYPDPNWQPATPRANIREIASAPTVSGGVVYVGTGDGRLIALDADPRDSNFPLVDQNAPHYNLVDQGLPDQASGLLNGPMPPYWPPAAPAPVTGLVPADVLWIWPQLDPVIPGAGTPADVAGGTATSKMVAIAANEVDAAGNRRSTIYAMTKPTYAVGDANRLMQVDGDSHVVWMMNEASGTNDQRPLNHPQTAMQVGDDSHLFADTGNDRVVLLDRDGKVTWEATQFYDPYYVLPAGEYRTGTGYSGEQNMRIARLRTPTDAIQWNSPDVDDTDPTKANPAVTVKHTLISDAGNNRVIEIVDKYMAGTNNLLGRSGGGVWYHVVVWASQTNAGHRDLWGIFRAPQRFRYVSAQPIEFDMATDSTTGLKYPTYARRVLCAIGNYALWRADGRRMQAPGACVAILTSDPAITKRTDQSAARGRAYILDDPNEQGYVSMIGDSGAGVRVMDRPVSIRRYHFQTRLDGTEELHDLYVDATGIYEWVVPGTAPTHLPTLATANVNGDAYQAVSAAAGSLFSQFLRENYRDLLGADTADARQFLPGSVAVSPCGGWIVTNKVMDRKLSNTLLQRGDAVDAGKIQVFRVNSCPVPAGNYDPSQPNFGYTPGSVTWLCGPKLCDGSGRDLRADLINPMYAVRVK